MIAFVEGLALGLAYAMPIGMQNLFVIQQALSGSKKNAYLTASAVSIADVSLAFACFFGMAKILILIPILKWVLLFGGAAFLIWTAYGLLRSNEKVFTSTANPLSKLAIFRAAFILTWCNPHAILDGSILLGSFSAKLHSFDVPAFLLGLAFASPLWFFTLTSVMVLASNLATPGRIVWLNRFAGVALLLLAFGLLSSAYN